MEKDPLLCGAKAFPFLEVFEMMKLPGFLLRASVRMTSNKEKHEKPLVSSSLKRRIWLSVFKQPVILGFEKINGILLVQKLYVSICQFL